MTWEKTKQEIFRDFLTKPRRHSDVEKMNRNGFSGFKNSVSLRLCERSYSIPFGPRRLGRGHACLRQAKRGRQVDEAQRVTPQHSDFGCLPVRVRTRTGGSAWVVNFLKRIPPILLAGTALAGEPALTVEPRELRGVPGEPLRIELTVETVDAVPVRLRIPAVSNLLVRTVERIPIRRTESGRFVHQRIVIWQGLEAETVTLTNLIAETSSGRLTFPEVRITVEAVEPARLPARPEPSATVPDHAE